MPLSQTGSYMKTSTKPTSQTWSYTIKHIGSYVMTHLSYYHSSQYNDIYT
ncbi:Manganese transport MntH [Gossypium arboreum]|uniref:Manganese transport MntH n=1 Tax=Gossypium arboreum TaxID=29729 RepID=A0A0B0NQK1_GOSAR|nr:Manganese transport MntH [Gossypium arboreum]